MPNADLGLHSSFALLLAAITLFRERLKGDVLLFVLWAVVPFLYLDFGARTSGATGRSRSRHGTST